MNADSTQLDLLAQAQALGAALGVGLLIGLERGWRERERPEGGRVAGLRTFALIGLTGGLLALLSPAPLPLLAAGLLAVAALFAVSFRQAAQADGSLSITTAVAGLATFALGALAASGHAVLAIGSAVVVALLLDLKALLHGWLRRIEPAELNAVLQLGVLTAVILPLLPNASYGPYGALNPHQIWLAVVLITGLSLLGHVATRWRGAHQGLLWTGLLGGLASSTAATLALARSARDQPATHAAAVAAIVAASGVMFLRMLVVITALQPALLTSLGLALLLPAVASFAFTAWLWRRARHPDPAAAQPPPGRVFDLGTAIGFGLVLAVVAVLSRAASEAFGAAGVFAVAFVSGLADVDAILVSSAQMQAQGVLQAPAAAGAIVLAAMANMLTKAAMSWAIAGREVGLRVAGGYLAMALAGLGAAAWQAL